MTQVTAGGGFRYPSNVPTVMRPWKDSLGDQYDNVVALLEDRDRALEDYFRSMAPVFDQVLTEEGTSSTTPVTLSGPSVTARLPRGTAIVQAGGTLEAFGGTRQPQILLFIDGVQYQNLVAILNNQTANALWITGGSSYLISGLSAGDHIFDLRYKVPEGTPVAFSNRFIQVTPIP